LGQAPAISPDASGLVGYHSQYEGATENVTGTQEEEPTYPELLRVRGESNKNEEVHTILGWTTGKDYPALIEISLPIQDPGEEIYMRDNCEKK
jgi:hypothetical protein